MHTIWPVFCDTILDPLPKLHLHLLPGKKTELNMSLQLLKLIRSTVSTDALSSITDQHSFK